MNLNLRSLALTTTLSAAVLLAASGAAQAQMGRMPSQQPNYSPGTNPNDPNGLNSIGNMAINNFSDTDFAKEAAEGGMAEVKFGQLAQDKGASDAVKQFGKRMVDEHSQANDKLRAVAEQENLKLPSALDKHNQSAYDKLSKLSGEAFDRAYARDMVKDHENDVQAFEQEARNGRDSPIKSFASETLPTLEDHLKMAREMEHSVDAAAKNGSGKGP